MLAAINSTARLIEEAKVACERVERMTHDLHQAPPPVAQPDAPAAPDTADSMQQALDLSNERLREITDLMHRMKHMSEESAAAIPRDEAVPAPHPVQLRSRMKVV